MTKRARPMTEEEFMKFLGTGEPLELLRARHAEYLAWARAPRDEPAEESPVRVRVTRGRPPKGQEAPVQLKALKMPASFWTQMEALAREAGLNLHAAMREAVIAWTREHQRKA